MRAEKGGSSVYRRQMNDIACIEFDIFLKSLMQQMRQMLGASFEIQHKLIDIV